MTLRDFQQDFNKKFKNTLNKNFPGHLQRTVQQTLNKTFSKTLNSSLHLINEILPEGPLRNLSHALELLRPFYSSLGLRISRLGQKQVEIKIPSWSKNCDENGSILDPVIISAGVEAGRLLWQHNWPTTNLKVESREIQFRRLKSLPGDLSLRAELGDIPREAAFAELHGQSQSSVSMNFLVFDENEQISCELTISYHLSALEQLGYK